MKDKTTLIGLPIFTTILGIIWIIWLSTVNYSNEFSGLMIVTWSLLWLVYFAVLLIIAAIIKVVSKKTIMFKAILFSFYVLLLILIISLLLITFVFS